MLSTSRTTRVLAIAGSVLCIGVLSLVVRPADSFPKYRESAAGGWCAGCHGDFMDGFSPKGTVFPFDSKHAMHRASSAMNTKCDLCHYDGDDNNPDVNFSDSDGFGGAPGFGCLGCHGRDYGDAVKGVGLREHHRNVGVASCGASSCHQDDPEPLPENIAPPYYGSFDTKAWDQCNRAPTFGENFSLDEDNTFGLDNDGDTLYDEDDPDCDVIDCPADIDDDGVVGFGDLVSLLAAWGPCPGCPEDIDGDDVVGFNDLVTLLADWGPCV